MSMQTYKDIEYNLSKSDRKTASIYIERDGSVSVLAPEKWSQEQIDKVLERKRPWIYRGLAEWQDLNATRVTREFVSGEGFLYLGRTYRLRIVEKQTKPLMLKDGYFYLRSDAVEKPYIAFKEFYREKGEEKIAARVEYYKTKMGVNPGEVRIMELKNRWASCSEKQNLNFHWKCLMAPLNIIDYIVVHELAHLKYKNHTDAFWGEIDKVIPDYRGRKEWLRQNGAGMDL
jgi:predicted metal-dependent hydrolase